MAIGKEILGTEPISNHEAKKIAKRIEKEYTARDKELGYEIEQSIEFLNKRDNYKTVKEYNDTLKALKEFELPEIVKIELLNTKPKEEETVKAILAKRVEFDDDKVSKILKIFN